MPLNIEDIKPGRTYEGADGERRELLVLVTREDADGVSKSVEYKRGAYVRFAPLNAFAAWAVREVTNEA